jgi:hypothetical protein
MSNGLPWMVKLRMATKIWYLPEIDGTYVTVYVPSRLSATTACGRDAPLITTVTGSPPVLRSCPRTSRA